MYSRLKYILPYIWSVRESTRNPRIIPLMPKDCIWKINKRAASSEKNAFEQAQDAQIQIFLHMCKVSSGPLLSIHTRTFCNIQWFSSRTGRALIRLRGCAGWYGPSLCGYAQRYVFEWRGQNNVKTKNSNDSTLLQDCKIFSLMLRLNLIKLI